MSMGKIRVRILADTRWNTFYLIVYLMFLGIVLNVVLITNVVHKPGIIMVDTYTIFFYTLLTAPKVVIILNLILNGKMIKIYHSREWLCNCRYTVFLVFYLGILFVGTTKNANTRCCKDFLTVNLNGNALKNDLYVFTVTVVGIRIVILIVRF